MVITKTIFFYAMTHLSSFFVALKFLLITHQPQSKQKHDQAMATVAKHDRKKKWKCDDGKKSWRNKEKQKHNVTSNLLGNHMCESNLSWLLPGFTSW